MAKLRATARTNGKKRDMPKVRPSEAISRRKPKRGAAKKTASKDALAKKTATKKIAARNGRPDKPKAVTARRAKRAEAHPTPTGPSVHKVPPRSSRSSAVPRANDTLPEATAPVFDASLARAMAAVDAAYAPAPELDWGDTATSAPMEDLLVARWVRRGHILQELLRGHGAGGHQYRADLKRGRFVWIDPAGGVSAEARAEVLCSWSRTTSALAMAWADPLVRPSGAPRIHGMPSECDDVDEERAWRIAMQAAEARGAEYLYRVPTPPASYFVALSDLTFDPERRPWRPVAPVGLVIRRIADTRRAITSRAEPATVARDRLDGLGRELLHEAQYAYRDTDWVARLTRTGRRLQQLSLRIPRASYGTIAAGRPADEWVSLEIVAEVVAALELLEDEWAPFA